MATAMEEVTDLAVGGQVTQEVATAELHEFARLVFSSVGQPEVVEDGAQRLRERGATDNNFRTANLLQQWKVLGKQILKLHEGRPNGKDMIQNGEINVMFVTPSGDEVDARDGLELRRTALGYKVPLITTTAAMKAVVNALRGMKAGPLRVQSLQQVLGMNKVEVESR